MRSSLNWTAPVGALFAVAIVTNCGGSTTSPTGGSDASTDSASGSGGSSGGGSGGSSGSSSSSGGSSSGGGSGSSSGSSSSSGGGNCPACTDPGMTCCNGVDCTVDSQNDPDHCGACNVVCQGSTPFCQQGKCVATPCTGGGGPGCCGTQTCSSGEVCCEFEGPQDYVGCYAYDGGGAKCPPGCPACVSDRNVKRDIEPVDPQAVLEGLSRVPVSTWSYKSDDPSIRHMGPMAQDLYGEFGLGNTDRAYSPIDAHGVAFAAIQALYERVQQQEVRIQELERENAALSGRAGKRR